MNDELSQRESDILRAAVEAFIASAEPVASAHLKSRCRLQASPATIRNVMAEMERRGLNVTDAVRRRMHESLWYAVAKARRRGLRRLPAELAPFVDPPAPKPPREAIGRRATQITRIS